MDTKEFEALDPVHYSPVDINGAVLGTPFPVVHDQLERVVVVLAPHCQISDLLPIGCLIVIGDHAYHQHVVAKLNDGVGVVCEQGVQEGTKHASLRGLRVEGQRADLLLPTLTTWGRPVRKSRIQLQREVFNPRVSLVMNLEGTMVLNAELCCNL